MAKRPDQAVILVGGFGVRLQPLTKLVPKPMIRFGGIPFVEYIVRRLKVNGFKKIIFLTGYKSDQFIEYFGDGQKFGLNISYCETPEHFGTGARLRAAKNFLDDFFFLLYGDVFWPFNFELLWKEFINSRAFCQIVAYNNQDNFSKSNLSLRLDGFVEFYRKGVVESVLTHVDIGHMIIDKAMILSMFDIKGNDFSLESELFGHLCKIGKLKAFVTDHRYYSLGRLTNIFKVQRHLMGCKYIILDRDGVLNKKMPKGEYVTNWADWTWVDGSLEALAYLRRGGIRVLIVTNQAGLSLGKYSQVALDNIHTNMLRDVRDSGGEIEQIYFCPHHWDDGCDCRKPKPGMLIRAQKDYDLDLTNTLFVGDEDSDSDAAKAAGAQFIKCSSDKTLLSIVREMF